MLTRNEFENQFYERTKLFVIIDADYRYMIQDGEDSWKYRQEVEDYCEKMRFEENKDNSVVQVMRKKIQDNFKQKIKNMQQRIQEADEYIKAFDDKQVQVLRQECIGLEAKLQLKQEKVMKMKKEVL